jgi:hypothetical protein
MKTKIVVICAWVALGVFNFGAMNAEIKYESHTEYASLHQSQRDNIGFIVGESCIVPPIEFVTALFITNFMQHGWTLKPWGPQ